MHNNKIIAILKTLRKEEIKQLLLFLPLVSSNNKLFLFAQTILVHYPAFENRALEKEQLFKKIFPGKKYEDVQIRLLTSALNKALQQFFVFIHCQENNGLFSSVLFSEFEKRNLHKQLEFQKEEILKNELVIEENNIKTFLYEYLNQETHRNYLYKNQNRTVEPNLQVLSNSLDLHYIINKLKIYCEALNYQTLSKAQYQIEFIDTILPYIENSNLVKNTLVQLYLGILQLFRQTSNLEQVYISIKKLFFEKYDRLNSSEADNIYGLIKNYCIRQSNKGNTFFVAELLELYKFEISQFQRKKEKDFSALTYKNAITIALRLNQFSWVKEFIPEFARFIAPTLRENAFHFNMAQYYFAIKEYKKINAHLQKIDGTDLFLIFSSKALQIRTFYELGEIMPLESLLQSFRLFVTSKKKIGYHASNYLNFIKFVSKLNQFKYKDDEIKKLKKLEQAIENEKGIVEKPWLLAKVKEAMVGV